MKESGKKRFKIFTIEISSAGGEREEESSGRSPITSDRASCVADFGMPIGHLQTHLHRFATALSKRRYERGSHIGLSRVGRPHVEIPAGSTPNGPTTESGHRINRAKLKIEMRRNSSVLFFKILLISTVT